MVIFCEAQSNTIAAFRFPPYLIPFPNGHPIRLRLFQIPAVSVKMARLLRTQSKQVDGRSRESWLRSWVFISLVHSNSVEVGFVLEESKSMEAIIFLNALWKDWKQATGYPSDGANTWKFQRSSAASTMCSYIHIAVCSHFKNAASVASWEVGRSQPSLHPTFPLSKLKSQFSNYFGNKVK